MEKALKDVRVLDLSDVLAGPFCTSMLGEFGCEVLDIEPPGGGYLRRLYTTSSLEAKRRTFAERKRNKKSITLNLKSEVGKRVFLELVKKSDVIVQNFAVGVMERLGISYDVLSQTNAGIIYCAISGFGQYGAYKDKIAFDPIIQAATGLTNVNGYGDRPPVRCGISLGDYVCALYAVIGILTALHYRDVTGKGQMIDVAMYDALCSFLGHWLDRTMMTGKQPPRTGNHHPSSSPTGSYMTKDGKYVFIVVQPDDQWQRFVKLIGGSDELSGWNLPTRVARADEIDSITEKWTKTKTVSEAVAELDKARIAASPVFSVDEVINDPHAKAREMFMDVEDSIGRLSGVKGIAPKLSETPGRFETGYIELGTHNNEVYSQLLGYSTDKIAKLRKEGVI